MNFKHKNTIIGLYNLYNKFKIHVVWLVSVQLKKNFDQFKNILIWDNFPPLIKAYAYSFALSLCKLVHMLFKQIWTYLEVLSLFEEILSFFIQYNKGKLMCNTIIKCTGLKLNLTCSLRLTCQLINKFCFIK